VSGVRWVPRVVVYGLFAAIVVTAAFDATLWPLNGWRLFSQMREPRSTAVAVVVEGAGGERRLDASTIWREYRSLGHAVALVGRQGSDGLESLCHVLLSEVGATEPGVSGLRIERTSSRLVDDPDTGELRVEVEQRSVLQRCGP
jgi:hypothetical protein